MFPAIRESFKRHRTLVVGIVAFCVVLWLANWVVFRFTHSITRDAFVDSNLINVAPQVSGTIVEMRVLEQDVVSRGQLLAIVDPSTYTQKVEFAKARLAVEEEGFHRAEVDFALLKETVPRQIQIAEQKLSIAMDDVGRYRDALDMITRDVKKGVTAAVHTVEAAKARLLMANKDFRRYEALSKAQSVPVRRFQEATRAYQVAQSEVKVAEAKLGMAEADTNQTRIAKQDLQAARHAVSQARAELDLASLGELEIEVGRLRVAEQARRVEEALSALQLAEVNLMFTRVLAPYDAVIAKKWRHLGDYAHTGQPIFSMYNTDLMYVTTNLEETLLKGVHPGNKVHLDVEAYSKPFSGRVLWIGNATDAKFSLIPRDVSSGEFTHIVQRIPVRIWIERDARWPLLKPGLSVKVTISHGRGDPAWAEETLRKEAEIENLGRYTP